VSLVPSAATADLEVLHYTGYSSGAGGVNSALRALAAEASFASVLGVHPDFPAADARGLPLWRSVALDAERLSAVTLWRTRRVAGNVRSWLRARGGRIYHGHSRAGLLVSLWLQAMGEQRAVSTVRCFGRQRWLYRLAQARLGDRLHWLGPAMKRHYGVAPFDWANCWPDAIGREAVRRPENWTRRPEVTFGAVGALVPVKEWETLMRAVAKLPGECAVRVRHAGAENGTVASADYARTLRRLAGELHLDARWEWCGPIDEMTEFYGSVDCLVVASRWEASSMAALEAIAGGVPVLAHADSGTTDLIARTAGGWTFQDEHDLTARLRELADGALRARWRRDDEGLAFFSAQRVAAEHERFYRRLLSLTS